MRARLPSPVLRVLRWLWRAAALLGVVQLLLMGTPVLKIWLSAISTGWGSPDGDVLIILGGDVIAPDVMGVSSWWRITHALYEIRANRFRRIVITGRDSSVQMRDFLVFEGIPASVITIENQADSTHENALFVSRLLSRDKGRKVLLTSDFHMRRALAAFKKEGIIASPIPCPDLSKRLTDRTQRFGLFCELFGELVKTEWYRVQGWV